MIFRPCLQDSSATPQSNRSRAMIETIVDDFRRSFVGRLVIICYFRTEHVCLCSRTNQRTSVFMCNVLLAFACVPLRYLPPSFFLLNGKQIVRLFLYTLSRALAKSKCKNNSIGGKLWCLFVEPLIGLLFDSYELRRRAARATGTNYCSLAA